MAGSSLLSAQSPDYLLRIEDCPELDDAAVRRLVSLETGAVITAGSADAATVLTVRCRGPQAFAGIIRHGDAPAVQRTVDLTSVPSTSRPRLIALALVELLDRLRLERGASAPREPAPVASEVSLKAPPGSTQAAPAAVLGAFASTRRFGAHPFSWGAGVFVELPRWGSVGVGLDAVLEGARARVPLGSANSLLGSVAVAATLALRTGPFEWRPHLGARVGTVFLVGDPADSTHLVGSWVIGPWFGPVLGTRLRWSLESGVAPFVGVEGGWSLSSVRARSAEQIALSVEGPWVGLAVGVVFGGPPS